MDARITAKGRTQNQPDYRQLYNSAINNLSNRACKFRSPYSDSRPRKSKENIAVTGAAEYLNTIK